MDTRYRIQDESGRVWDSTNHKWVRATSGDYNTYKSFEAAVAAARKTKHPCFQNRGARVLEDKEFMT